jgi:hypothetical protein
MEIDTLEIYKRQSVCCHLDEFDSTFASETDVIEVCEWKNCEGYDIYINDNHYSLSRGELKAINYLIEQLNKK